MGSAFREILEGSQDTAQECAKEWLDAIGEGPKELRQCLQSIHRVSTSGRISPRTDTENICGRCPRCSPTLGEPRDTSKASRGERVLARGDALRVTRNTLRPSTTPLTICNQPGRQEFPERNCESSEAPFDPQQTALTAEQDRLAL